MHVQHLLTFLHRDLGVHVDGFMAVAAHTHIVGGVISATTGKKADVICAAHVACEAVMRLLKPGAKVYPTAPEILNHATSYSTSRLPKLPCSSYSRIFIQNKDITAVIKQVADAYHVNPVEGVLSHVMRRYLIDGEKVIMNKSTPDQIAEEYEVEESDVYAIDIIMSSGEGKVTPPPLFFFFFPLLPLLF